MEEKNSNFNSALKKSAMFINKFFFLILLFFYYEINRDN